VQTCALPIFGRAKRFIKPFGVRVDLDRVEAVLRDAGFTAMCTGDDQRLVAGVERPADVEEVRQLLRDRLALPASAVRVVAVDELPRLESGKPDHQRLLELAARDGAPPDAHRTPERPTVDEA